MQTFEETSGYVRLEWVNKWPNSMTDMMMIMMVVVVMIVFSSDEAFTKKHGFRLFTETSNIPEIVVVNSTISQTLESVSKLFPGLKTWLIFVCR